MHYRFPKMKITTAMMSCTSPAMNRQCAAVLSGNPINRTAPTIINRIPVMNSTQKRAFVVFSFQLICTVMNMTRIIQTSNPNPYVERTKRTQACMKTPPGLKDPDRSFT